MFHGLGDAGASNDDGSYTGDTGQSVVSMQYYRDKAAQFQVTMQALDQAAQAAAEMIELTDDAELISDLYDFLSDFEDKKYQFRYTAEAINAGGAVVNASGGRFPVLSVPQGLNLAPIIMGAAAIAAIGTAAALIVWGNTWLKGVSQRMATAAAAAQIDDPQLKAAFLEKANAAQAAADASEGSPFSTIANSVKWIAIAAGVYYAYQAFAKHRGD